MEKKGESDKQMVCGKQNRNGKSLEYILAKTIACGMEIKNVHYHNYHQKYLLMPDNLKKDFEVFANIVYEYIKKTYKHTFDRLILENDSIGKCGNSSDITLHFGKEQLRLSIKNNKRYVKSQRPSALPRQCGYRNTTLVAKGYKDQYNKVCSNFYESYKAYHYFRDIGRDPIKKLYADINTIVSTFLKNTEIKHMGEMFKFVLDDNIQIVNSKKNIHIIDFTNIQIPNKYDVSINRLGYIIINTDTGMSISMRLHTASSRLTKNISLKYDTTVVNYGINVVSSVLAKDGH